jgi:hypothetical protein
MKSWTVFGDGFTVTVRGERMRTEGGMLIFSACGEIVALFASGQWNRCEQIVGALYG